MFDLRIPYDLRTFIDSVRGFSCRAVYILRCVSYIKDNEIDVNEYYENIKYDRTKKYDKKGEDAS